VIAINDLTRHNHALLAELEAATRAVTASGWYILGPRVRARPMRWVWATAPTRWKSLPVTERYAAEVLTLPCFPELTNEEVGRVAAEVRTAALNG
jgi:hypothetical protein